MLDKTKIRMDSIQTHLEVLEMLLSRNHTWTTEPMRREIREAHEKIIDLIKQASNEYSALLKLYRNDHS
jgi:hypothetical protein